MIEGVNPLVISCIYPDLFYRFGDHPYYLKVMRKKNPVRAFLGMYRQGDFDWVRLPAVVIRGSNNKVIKRVVCRSNQHAITLSRELNKKLEAFVEEIKR